MYRVKLTYFRLSGKYYSEGEYESAKTHLFEIWREVRQFLLTRKLPGLVEGCSEFIILVDVPEHPHEHPRLIIPKDTEEMNQAS